MTATYKAWMAAFDAVAVAFDACYPDLDDPRYVEACAAADAAGEAHDKSDKGLVES